MRVMAELDNIQKELEKLAKDLAELRAERAVEPPSAAPPAGEAGSGSTAVDEGTEALRKLADYVTTRAGEAEETLAEHPLVGVAAAFLLGLAIGRISSR
jgi:ElaB/YqjD/DUF883 family membrane-anchored ribosome-binding protein